MVLPAVIYALLLLSASFEREDLSFSRKKEILNWWVVILTVFRGFRWETGTDWEQYYEVFLSADWDNIFSFQRTSSVQMEAGYMLLNVLLKIFGENYTLFLVVTNFFVLYAYRQFAVTNSTTPILVFVLIIFSTQFFPVRIGIAVAVIMLGLCHFSERRIKRVLIFSLIAMSIHSSAVAFIPVYLFGIYFRKIPTTLAVTSAIILMLISQTTVYKETLFSIAGSLNVLGEETAHKFNTYLDYNVTVNSGVKVVITGIISNSIFIVLLFLFGNMIDKNSPYLRDSNINYNFLFNVYFVFMMIAIAFPGDNMAGLRRLQNYFMFAFPVLFSTYIVVNKRKYPAYSLIYTLAFLFFVLFRSYSMFFGGHLESNFPYLSIFDDAF